MKKTVLISAICCFLVISCTVLPYDKFCDQNRARFEAMRPVKNFAYTYRIRPQTLAGVAGLPTYCGVSLTQQEKNTLSEVLTPKVDKRIENALREETDQDGVVYKVLKDFKDNTRIVSVRGLLSRAGLLLQ